MKHHHPWKKMFVLFVVFILAIFLSFDCSRKPDIEENADIGGKDSTEFDELFNTTTASENSKKESDDEEEVLKLLGLTKQEKSEKQEVVEEKAPPEVDFNKEIESLEKEIDSKKLEIQKLHAEVDTQQKKNNELSIELANERNKPKGRASFTPTSGGYRGRYENARAEYEARRYKVAINLFEELLASNPNNSYADNCQYWIGECYYGLANFTKAIAAFEKVFSFPKSNKNDDSQLKLGMCYIRLNEKERAKEEFKRLINHYPKSEYVSQARRFLSKY